MRRKSQNRIGIIAQYGWVISLFLILLTVAIQLTLWRVIPVFIELYQSFGIEQLPIVPYYQVIFIVMIIAELLLGVVMVLLVFTEPSSTIKKTLAAGFWLYGLSLMVMVMVAIGLMYFPIFQMSSVV